MSIRSLALSGLCLALLINFWSILTGLLWLENTSYILFFLVSYLMVFSRRKMLNSSFYLFTGFTVASYLMRYLNPEFYSAEFSMIFLSISYTVLIVEGLKYVVIKNGGYFMLLYFFGIVGINGGLMGYHLLELREYIPGFMAYSVYLIYYFILFILGIISFIYYLNSYSKRSMFFVSLALGLIFADVLRDMGVFYLRDLSVEIIETIIRLGCAVFAVHFFVTEEKPLRLTNLI
ncbi:MAG TPA: hypothetical protein VK941_07015 [Gillisia sp.]|nr:hypothetical protein [Gillisia sp.]